jgi:hypothetical protein
MGSFDASSVRDLLASMGCLPTVYTVGGVEAVFPGLNILNSSSVIALTLPTPAVGDQQVGGDDGKVVEFFDPVGAAHTVITPANKVSPSHKTCTFGGTAGSNFALIAWAGIWYPCGTALGVTFS